MKGYIPYIIFIIAGIALYILDYFIFSKRKYTKYISIIALLTLFWILATFKATSVGIDSITYEGLYQSITQRDFLSVLSEYQLEIGFYGLVYLFAKIQIPFLIFKGLCYLAEAVLLFFAFKKVRFNVALLLTYLCIGFLSLSFSALRQGIAIAIVTFGFSLFASEKDSSPGIKKTVVYAALTILAATFHSSALACLLLIPFLFHKIKIHTPFILLAFLAFIPRIVAVLFSVFGGFTGYDYVTYSSRISFKLILYIVILVVSLILGQKEITSRFKLTNIVEPYEFSFLDSIMFFVAYLCLVFASFNIFSQILARISFYFIMGVVYFIFRSKEAIKNHKLSFIVELAIMVAFGAYLLLDSKTLGIYPYEFI